MASSRHTQERSVQLLHAWYLEDAREEGVFSEISTKYADRNGGYTQIFKLGPRKGDGAEMAIIRLIDEN